MSVECTIVFSIIILVLCCIVLKRIMDNLFKTIPPCVECVHCLKGVPHYHCNKVRDGVTGEPSFCAVARRMFACEFEKK